MPNDLDWSHIQTFVAVAEHGSLSAAARRLGGSQPTMGRHIAALEAVLGVALFARTSAGLELTATGLDLLHDARGMATSANRLALVAEGRSTALSGTVRITASEIVATYTLPAILTALRREEPEIEIEVVASNATENLLQREADIAIRMYRPAQADVIARKVGDLEVGMFGAHAYIERRGAPRDLADFASHDVVGYDRDEQIIDGFREAGMLVDRHFFSFRCDNQVVAWNMVVAGFGVGFNQLEIGRAEPRVVRLLPEADLPTLPVWLAAHAELKTSARVRRVFDYLAEALSHASKPPA
ncbi:MAG: LysR family transcriptional regulator [Alphaproteobacteria bacterium]